MTTHFTATSTTDEVLSNVDLSGKRVLITGVSAGLGVETARALVSRGASVTGTARNLKKAETAVRKIRSVAQNSRGSLDLIELDLASLSSVVAAADRLLAAQHRFDIVIANAGVMATPEGKTTDGFETQIGTNFIGHFVLIKRLLPLLNAGSRIILLSSAAHAISDVDTGDLNFETTAYDPWLAYGRSKTAVALLAVELERRYGSQGIHSASVHPGAIQTELQRHYSKEVDEAFIAQINEANAKRGLPPFQWKTVQQGAATSVWAAAVASATEIAGKYCENCHVADINDSEGVTDGVRSYAQDPVHASALWDEAERLIKDKFGNA
ncbi:SDR family NAD(P)-dependent oxidoreductase [Cronobacter dublinensis]|uniref:SDR family NAD(P)-dependent oxidoreductase n=1 Tax=Cronobacter dublinensis TaxID=413497 RepID=UPI001D494EA0|nr:SDR family NAD(P)-dependent oxidoreductase [Cronobacter dublinensis subsp. dublinensis]ELY9424902.1 SDR family NAD(P)-dependent oxidoreductase [Cronobacter dublinensis]EGT5671095.1 SDR family NAD(P)-dependent oxidoreductase [Cronobacter dublinensis subsp. dublinensis]EGT5675264.1 SDR family NAD(P)-dependent oxidoreductase [Cronobacter dublinensis subsp. dublinensis]EGT5679559.1 SDR family NAD(P)-dependent oxidoreductase [Cronobacter dublinensis subsp. dublinensis]